MTDKDIDELKKSINENLSDGDVAEILRKEIDEVLSCDRPPKRVLDSKYLKCKVEVTDLSDVSDDPIHEEIRKELYAPLSVKMPVIQFDVAGELAALREENRKLLDTLANYDMAVSELEFRLETLWSQHDTLLREFFHETAAMSMTCSKPN
jgi:hypothetical protein